MGAEPPTRAALEQLRPLALAELITQYGKDSDVGRLADEVLAGKVEERRRRRGA